MIKQAALQEKAEVQLKTAMRWRMFLPEENLLAALLEMLSVLPQKNCYYSGEVSASGSAGGIVGNVWGGTIQNCVSLAESVTGSNTNRIVGNIYNLTLTNNYAWSDPALSADDEAGLNGANLTYTNGELSKQFSGIFGSDNSAWQFTDNGLPILKDVGGTQLSELPKCMTGVGFDGFGIKNKPPISFAMSMI